MNPITLFLLAAVFIAFLGPVLTILSVIAHASVESAKETERARALQIRQDDADRRAQLHQAKIEKESNAIVLQDLKIEIERLKLAALEKEVNPPAFDVKDYSS